MKIVCKENAELKPNPFNADVRILSLDAKTEILHLELKPKELLSPVRIEQEAFFYILEGNPEVIIDKEKQFVNSEALVHCPAGSLHCINNPQNITARILVIKICK